MSLKYLRKNRYLIFKRLDKDTVEVWNDILEEGYEMNLHDARFLYALNGTNDPYEIDLDMPCQEVTFMLEAFIEEGLVDYGERIRILGIGSMIMPLWLPKVTRIHRLLAIIWNRILMLCFIPVFFMGMKILFFKEFRWGGAESAHPILWAVIFTIFCTFLHELSHAAAALDYGGRIYEFGITIHYFFPGAYVLISKNNIKNRMKRAQVMAAGIESNLLMTGLCLCLLKCEYFDQFSLLASVLLNALLIFSNCSLINGADGLNIYQEFLCPDFLDKSWKLIRNPTRKSRLKQKGLNGKITILSCYLIVMMQLQFLLFDIIIIASVVNSFF